MQLKDSLDKILKNKNKIKKHLQKYYVRLGFNYTTYVILVAVWSLSKQESIKIGMSDAFKTEREKENQSKYFTRLVSARYLCTRHNCLFYSHNT